MQAFRDDGTHQRPSLRAAFFLTEGIQVHHWLPKANNGHDNPAPVATGGRCLVTQQSVILDAGQYTIQARWLSLLAEALLCALTTLHVYVNEGSST